MNKSVTVAIICEGPTEQTFVRDVLAPAFGARHIFLEAQLIGTPGHKGGHVIFKRALFDIERRLKQRRDVYVSTMFDLYGIAPDWPGKARINKQMPAAQKAKVIENHTLNEVKKALVDFDVEQRFLPYLSVHEFEALLFSDPAVLASQLNVAQLHIDRILEERGEPEEINDSPLTAPSKRIEQLRPGYRKIVMGKVITEKIGIGRIRKQCPHFDSWINRLEALAQ